MLGRLITVALPSVSRRRISFNKVLKHVYGNIKERAKKVDL